MRHEKTPTPTLNQHTAHLFKSLHIPSWSEHKQPVKGFAEYWMLQSDSLGSNVIMEFRAFCTMPMNILMLFYNVFLIKWIICMWILLLWGIMYQINVCVALKVSGWCLTFPGAREEFDTDRRGGGIRGVLGWWTEHSGEAAAMCTFGRGVVVGRVGEDGFRRSGAVSGPGRGRHGARRSAKRTPAEEAFGWAGWSTAELSLKSEH